MSHARSFGDPCAEAMAQYLKANNLKQSQLTREIFAQVTQEYFDYHMKKARTTKEALSEEEWIADLEADEANRGLNVRSEMAKAKLWLKLPANQGRKFTRRFFVNWLLKADRVILAGQETERGERPVVSNDPYRQPTFDWHRIIATKWPRESFPNRDAWEEGKWSEVPIHIRREIISLAV